LTRFFVWPKLLQLAVRLACVLLLVKALGGVKKPLAELKTGKTARDPAVFLAHDPSGVNPYGDFHRGVQNSRPLPENKKKKGNLSLL
jgi:hypothetical protein